MRKCIILGVFGFLIAAPAMAADKIALKLAIDPGTAWTFDQTQDSTSENKATSGGQSQVFSNKMHAHRVGKFEVLKIADGVPTSVKITFDEASETVADMTGQPQRKMPFPYAGKSVTLTRAADGSVSDDFDGKVDPAAMNELHSMIEQEGVIFPKEPVAIGDEWPADPKMLAKLLMLQGPQDKGGMTLKLLSVKEIGGRPTAEMKVSLAAFKEQQGMTFKMISQGVALIDLKTGHTIKTDMKGTTSTTGDQSGPGPNGQPMQYHVEGEGTLNTSLVSNLVGAGQPPLVNIGGNPLNPNPPANPLGSFAGKYSDGKLTADFSEAAGSYTGTIALGDKKFPASARPKGQGLEGSFESGSDKFEFTATLDGDTLTLISGGTTYKLKKAAVNPLGGGQVAPPNPLGQ